MTWRVSPGTNNSTSRMVEQGVALDWRPDAHAGFRSIFFILFYSILFYPILSHFTCFTHGWMLAGRQASKIYIYYIILYYIDSILSFQITSHHITSHHITSHTNNVGPYNNLAKLAAPHTWEERSRPT
ncbi:hypothetical protein EYC84_000620 [Monilinia fructicola]|uniref:Uncharacterized protein n=1 Tax=Monilinia fructicola TaxID=38448 RepID=A0A5M9JP62_MONFR|nr:hypothetical protein EYC84_000620 [Monilinia fructicola]